MATKDAKHYDAYLFTFKAEDWSGYEQFLKAWKEGRRKTEWWSSGSSKSIPKGVPIFLMKQGKAPTGIIAAGSTISACKTLKRWSNTKQRSVIGPHNNLLFTHFLDPEDDRLLDINDLPKKYWAARGSGMGLSPEDFREIKRRWSVLLGENASEKTKARKAPTLEENDADDDYKISNRDTRATAFEQIKQRRGRPAFRQKMLNIYGGRCAISGCEVTDVLEAAHIKSYLGDNDNNSKNGLLLRADLHTLFDLSLLGINPVTKAVHLHAALHGSEYDRFQGKKLRKAKTLPNPEALRLRWREFKEKE